MTVVDGAGSAVDPAGSPISSEDARFIPQSIEELFDLIATSADGDLVVATFDQDRGYPVNVYIDQIANAVDDELTYWVQDLVTR